MPFSAFASRVSQRVLVSAFALWLVATASAAAAPYESLRIETAAGGNAALLTATTLTAGDTLRAFAAGYDSAGVYWGAPTVTWAAVPNLAALDVAKSSTVLVSTATAGTFRLRASDANIGPVWSGDLTVQAASPTQIALFAQPGTGHPSLTALAVTTDSTLVLYARGFDAWGNDAGPIVAAWSLDAALGTLTPALAVLTVFDPRRTGSSVLHADAAGMPGRTLALQVTPGRLASLQIATRPGDPALGDTTLVAGKTLSLYANGNDADGNPLLVMPTVQWSTSAPSVVTLLPELPNRATALAVTPGTTRITASAGGITSDTGTLRVVAAPLARLRLSRAPDALVPFGATGLDADQTLELFAWGEDAYGHLLGPVAAYWTSTNAPVAAVPAGPSTSALVTLLHTGSARIVVARPDAVADSSATVTVTAGRPAQIRIETRADGSGSAIDAATLSCDSVLTVYAVRRDADGNFAGPSAAVWSLTANLGTLTPAYGPSTSFDARRPGSVRIAALDFLFTDATGTIDVMPGAPHHLTIEDPAGNPLAAPVLRPGDLLAARARLHDADDNGLELTPAEWSWQGDILAPAPSAPTDQFDWTATRVGSGRLVATSSGVWPDSSGWITVTTGPLARIEVQDASGQAATARTQSADSTLVLHAVAFDSGDNALGDATVSWSVESQGGLATVGPLVGSSTVLHPQSAGDVIVLARHAGGATDRSEVLHIVAGRAVRVGVQDAPDASGNPVGERSLIAGQSLPLFAVARDAQGNAVGPVDVSWIVHGNIGSVSIAFGPSTTFMAEHVDTGDVTLVHASLLGDRTGDLHVGVGPAARLAIEANPGDPEDTFGPATLAAGDSLSAAAVARDSFGNFVADVQANWTVEGDPGAIATSTAGPAARVFVRSLLPGRAHLHATWTSLVADSGDLVVRTGGLASITIESAPAGAEGGPVTDRSLAAGDVVLLYAVGRDPRGNVIGPIDVTWDVQGGIGRVEPTNGPSTTFTAEHPLDGLVRARTAGVADATSGAFTVTAGPPASLSIERRLGDPIDLLAATTLTTDDSLQAFAVLRDAFGNFAAAAAADWSLAGDPQVALLQPGSTVGAIQVSPRHPATTMLSAAWNTLVATSPPLQFLPGQPTGTIPIGALPDTLRADGSSQAHCSAGPIVDRFDNRVADGTRVDLLTNFGSFTAGNDLDPSRAGTQAATHDGSVEVTFVAPRDPGVAQIQVTSGQAQGAMQLACLPAARLTPLANTFTPARLQRGADLAATLSVRNDDPRALTITSGALRFHDGNGTPFESPLVDTTRLEANQAAPLAFAPTTIPLATSPGAYAPEVTVAGTDAGGAPFAITFVLPASSLRIDAGPRVHITARSPDRLTRGASVHFELDVLNVGDVATQLDAARCSFEAPGFTTTLDPTSMRQLDPGAPVHLRFLPAVWPATMPAGDVAPLVVLHGDTGTPAYSETLQVASVRVEESGDIVAVVGSLTPASTPLGARPELRLLVHNPGGSTLQLDSSTRIWLDTRNAGLAAPSIVPPDSSVELAFTALNLDGLAPGRFGMTLAARGTQNGASFSADRPLADSLIVFAPAALAIVGVRSSQSTVTRGQSEPWDVHLVVANSGQTAYRIDAVELHIVLGGIDRTDTYTFVRQKSFGAPLVPAALDTLYFRVLRTGPDVGLATLEANLHATDLATGQPIDVDTYRGGKGSVRVQAPALPAWGPLQLSQQAVVVGQSRPVDVTLAVRNAGEAAMQLDLASLATSLAPSPAVPVDVAIASGTSHLEAGESVALRYTLGPFAIPAGVLSLTATPQFVETNRALTMQVSARDSLPVNAPAHLMVVGSTAPLRVTGGQTSAWEARFVLRNAGGASAQVLGPHLQLQDAGVDVTNGFGVHEPTRFLGRNDLGLAAGTADTLAFTITSTDPTPRDLDLVLSASGLELESGRSLTLEAGVPPRLQVQTRPQVVLVDSTLTPRTASRAQEITLSVEVRNAGGAALQLDAAKCTIGIAGTNVGTRLATPLTLPGNAAATLQFLPLTADVASGSYALNLHLEGLENGNVYRTDLTISSLEIQPATSLEVVSVRPSQPVVTTGQLRPWNVRVAVKNYGAAARFESATLGFGRGTEDVSVGFGVFVPHSFLSGAATIASGAVDTLRFEINPTADVEGLVAIDVSLQVSDLNSGARLEAHSSGSARGSVLVAAAARPVIVALVPSQARVSAGQTSPWTVRCTLRNEGGTAWRPDWAQARLTLGLAADDSIVSPAPFGTGSAAVAPGASAQALFRVERTGAETGVLPLTLTLTGTQATDGTHIDALGAPADGPWVQRPGRAAIDSLRAVLVRVPYVNTGGVAHVAVDLANRGEAAITSSRIHLHTSGATPTDTLLAAAVAGDGVTSVDVALHAPTQPGPIHVEAMLEAAVDANDPSRDDATTSPRAAALDLVVERPGALQVTVVPGPSRVSAGQTSPWPLLVRAENLGDEPLQLQPPRASDVQFRRLGSELADYVVAAADSLEEGGLTIPGGARGTLRFRVTRTGETGGSIDISALVAARHANDPSLAIATGSGTGSIEVDAEPGLRILSTETVTYRRQHGFQDFRVHTGQPFVLRVIVENTGGTWLDSIRVQVDSQRGNSHVDAGLLSTLGPGQRAAVDLPTVAGTWLSQPGLPETFSAYVHSARDHNSGLAVLPGAAVDNIGLAYVERPARLALQAWIDSPLGARDGMLSVSQTFVLAARVENHGDADVSASGRISIDMPSGFSLEGGDLETFFAADSIVRWTLRAPATTSVSESLLARIAAVPLDLDSGDAAIIDQDRDTVTVQVHPSATLSCALNIQAPAGSSAGVASTGQRLDLELVVRGDPDLTSRQATLILPPGWTDLTNETSKRDLPADPEVRATWSLVTGNTAGRFPIVLHVAAHDRNDETQRSVSDTLVIQLERAVQLALSGAIVAPQEARAGRLLPGQHFTVRTTVRNHGETGAGPGTLRITTLPTGYTGDTSPRAFDFGIDGTAHVEWDITSPPHPRSGVQALRIALVSVPVDLHSGTAGGLDPDSASVQLAVSVADDGVTLDATPTESRLAAPGEHRVPLLAVEIGNSGAATIRIDSLGVVQMDAGVPAHRRLVSALYLVRADAVAETLTVEVTSAPLAWLALADGVAARLEPGVTARYTVLADLVADISPTALGIALRATPGGAPLVRASQASSGAPLPVRAPARSDLASAPLRVLTAALQAYNAPNPFHAGREITAIRYQVDTSSEVAVRIATLGGELVLETKRHEEAAGPSVHSFEWDGRNGVGQMVRNGVYICHVQVGERSSRFKIAVVR